MSEMVRKASTEEIVNHWILAVSCLLLMITGYAFLFKLEPIYAVFGGNASMKVVHNWAGVVFTLSLVGTIFNYLGESLTYDADDWAWIKMGGGYLSKHAIKAPPMGKLNTGQKFYYLVILAAGIVIAASGFSIWLVQGSRALTLVSHLMHNLAFILFVVAVPAHAYLGTLANPGTLQDHAFRHGTDRIRPEEISQVDEGDREDVVPSSKSSGFQVQNKNPVFDTQRRGFLSFILYSGFTALLAPYPAPCYRTLALPNSALRIILSPSSCHLVQPLHPLCDRRMGAEELHQTASGQRVHDEHVGSGRLCVGHRNDLGPALEFQERIGKARGAACDTCSAFVRFELPRARDGHLDKHGRDRRHDHHDQRRDRAAVHGRHHAGLRRRSWPTGPSGRAC